MHSQKILKHDLWTMLLHQERELKKILDSEAVPHRVKVDVEVLRRNNESLRMRLNKLFALSEQDGKPTTRR